MKILKLSDRISVKQNDIEVIVSPLSYSQKIEISNCVKMDGGLQKVDVQRTAMLTIAYSVKEVKGLEGYDASAYELQFTDDTKSKLTDECTSELVSALATSKIFGAINACLAGYLEENIEGVTMEVLAKK